tara:strand:+ start:36 stop:266 length:231 start_codon:yes stop_codon:yes gene_type:complete
MTFEEKKLKNHKNLHFGEKAIDRMVLGLFEESLLLKEYHRKHLIMLLLASTLNNESARKITEFIAEKTSEEIQHER